jgi:hypothetical protein
MSTNISLAKTAAGKKMIDVFERERQELIDRAKKTTRGI